MALIKCVDCGKRISDKAPACIHCGCPISVSQETKTSSKETEVSPTIGNARQMNEGAGCATLIIKVWLFLLLTSSVFMAIFYLSKNRHFSEINPFKSEPKQQKTLSVGTCSGGGPTSKLQGMLRDGWKVVGQSSFTKEQVFGVRRYTCHRTDYTLEK